MVCKAGLSRQETQQAHPQSATDASCVDVGSNIWRRPGMKEPGADDERREPLGMIPDRRVTSVKGSQGRRVMSVEDNIIFQYLGTYEDYNDYYHVHNMYVLYVGRYI